ncbi:MAG: PEP-CTERM sorting domain-containing protein, partial [Bryobacteraceae bacterium]
RLPSTVGGRRFLKTCLSKSLFACAIAVLAMSAPAFADSFDPSLPCNSTGTLCRIYLDVPITLNPGFFDFAGDVVVFDASFSPVDIVRFFPNFIDTGGGTGLGNEIFEFTLSQFPFPNLTVNAVGILQGPVVNGVAETIYDSPTGTEYDIFNTPPTSITPEPGSLFLLASGLLVGLWYKRRRPA